MTLRALHLENYKQYSQLDLEFRDGLVGIIGRNGAGKSTLFEAVLYCLYGKDESNKNLIRSSFADPKASVVLSLQFAVGSVEYAVKREFRGKTMAVQAELFKNDELIAKGVAPVNDEIVRILNMERDAFKRSVFSGQKELSELSDTTGEARKRMVRKMLGLDTLDDVQVRMNTDTRDLSSQIAGQRQNLLDEEVVRMLESDLAEQARALKEHDDELQKEQQKLRDVETEYRGVRERFEAEEQKLKRYNTLQQEVSRLQERLDGLQKQQETLTQKLRTLEAQEVKLKGQKDQFTAFERDKKDLQQLEAQRQRHLNRDAYLTQIAELEPSILQSRKHLEELSRMLATQAKTEAELEEKQALVASLDKQIEHKREEFNQVKSRTEALAVRVEERRNKIQDLQAIGREGTCPTCFQPVLEAYDQVLDQLNREIDALQGSELAALKTQQEEVRKDGHLLRVRLEETRKDVERLLAEKTRLQEFAKQKKHEEGILKNYEAQLTRIQVVLREIGNVHFDEKQYALLKSSVEVAEPAYLQYNTELNYIARELPATRTALQQAQAAAAETGQALEQLSADRNRTGYQPEAYEAVKQALTQFADAYTAQSTTVRNLEKTGMELRNASEKIREKLLANARIKEQVSAKLEEVELLKKLTELLIQFKTEILEKVSPSISSEASALFSRITRGKYERIHVDENFDFFIADGGLFYPIERFSGGEIDLANFCLRIAITKAIMDLSGNGQSVEFLAFDEIFGSQDEERRHEMMLALYYLQEQFRQIYIVSHIDSQKDYFPNLLEVTYQPGGSVVKWV